MTGDIRLRFAAHIICGILASFCWSAEAEAETVVRGMVHDSLSGEALAGASVAIERTELATRTDEHGSFRFDAVPAGSWILRCSHVGYRESRRFLTIGVDDTLIIPSLRLVPRPVDVGGISVVDDPGVEAIPAATRVVLSQHEIEQSPGHAGDISRVVSLHPSVAESGDAFNSLAVRGGHPNETRFVIDGFTVPNINHFPLPGSSGGSYSLIRTSLVSGLDFSPGNSPPNHGGYLSGLMDVQLRQGRQDRIGGTLGAGLSGLSLDLEGPLPAKRGSWLVSVRRSFVDWLAESVDAGIAPKYADAVLTADLHLSRSHDLNVMGLFGADNLQITESIALEEGYAFIGNVEATEWSAGLRWRARWHPRFSSTTTLSTSSLTHGIDVDWVITGVPYANDRSVEREYRGEFIGRWRPDDQLRFSLGIDWHTASDHIRVSSDQAETTLGYRVYLDPVSERINASNIGFSVAAEVMLSESFRGLLGMRGDYFHQGEGWHPGPRIGAVWYPFTHWRVSTGLGWYYQLLPTRLPLLARYQEQLSDPWVRSFTFGIKTERGSLSVSAEAYHKYYSGFPMDMAYGGVGFPFDDPGRDYIPRAYWYLVDSGKAEAYGCELVAKRDFADDLYGLAVFGLSQSRYRDLGGVWRARSHQTEIRFGCEGGVSLGRGFAISARLQIQSGAPTTPIDTAATILSGRTILQRETFNKARLPTYYNANLRVEKSVVMRASTLTMYISIWNLLDNKRVLEYYWDFITDTLRSRDEWGIIPIIGVEWEF